MSWKGAVVADHDFPELAALLSRGPSDVLDEAPPPSLWAALEAEVFRSPAADVVPITAARRARFRGPLLAMVAVAAAALVAVPAGLAIRSARAPKCPAETASLSALADFNGTGKAALASGCSLELDLSALPPLQDGYYEAWLLQVEDGQLRDLVPLGDLNSPQATYAVSKVDLKRYNVVDISREPNDGNPAHSGDSVLRGQLQ